MRECLKLDPEHKDCFPHYKKVKKVAKLVQDMQTNFNENNYQACAAAAKKVITKHAIHRSFFLIV